jgi:adenine phosphoribosyltransferase
MRRLSTSHSKSCDYDFHLRNNLASISEAVKLRLRAIPDYPQPGILFQDITPVLADADLFRQVTQAIADPFSNAGITHVVGIEARGFILGGPVAFHLGAGFVPVRKAGKLPWKALKREYALEYGTNIVEAHEDAVKNGDRVLIVDDVLATGGTAQAAGDLVRDLGGMVVGWSFLLELGFLHGRAKLTSAPAEAVLVL